MKHRTAAVTSAALCMLLSASVVADIWVIEPSLTLDQRFDDNYYLLAPSGGSTSATRGVAEFGLSREAADYVFKGLARVDALFTNNTDAGQEELDSNFIAAIDARRRTQRSRYGVRVNFKQDTPSRDIAADISDNDSIAEDTSGKLVTQTYSSNVAREEYFIEPSFAYDISRRLELTLRGKLTSVEHELPSPQDAIYEQYLGQLQNSNASEAERLPYDAVTIDDVGVFTPNGELDDYREAELAMGLRFRYTPIVTLTGTLSYSDLTAEVLADEDLELFTDPPQYVQDPDERNILRRLRRDKVSTTSRLVLGYERLLTPTLQFILDGGVYTSAIDDSDTYRAGEDVLKINFETGEPVPAPEVGKTSGDGWLGGLALRYDAGATRYTARFAVDVQPSSAGSQAETRQLTGEMTRTLSPRLQVSFRGRAFEPSRVGDEEADRFARRFISFEPRVQWQYSRNWTLTAAYRYRRQKAIVDPAPAESNAVLLAIRYTPPSELRDTARAAGL